MVEYPEAWPANPAPGSARRRLDSWKQIARYLNRHVTTVRRWEHAEGLPVHRHLHARLGSAYAFTDELDAWFDARRCGGEIVADAPPRAAAIVPAEPPPARRGRAAVAARAHDRAVPVGAARLRAVCVAGGLVLSVAVLVAGVQFAARSITTLHVPVATGAATIDPAARDQFLRAQFLFGRRQPGDLEGAVASYRRALELEPGFARGWAGLAGAYYVASYEPARLGLTRSEALDLMRDAADRGLLLDPKLAEAHVRLANYRMEIGDRAGARDRIRYAQRLDAEDTLLLRVLAGMALSDGNPVEAVRLQRQSVVRDPLALAARATLGAYLFHAGRFADAGAELATVLQFIGQAVTTDDELTVGVQWDLARSLIAERRFAEALVLASAWPEGARRNHVVALAQQGLGHAAEASAALAQLSTAIRPDCLAWMAEVYAFRGDTDQAFKWLAAASEQGRRIGERSPPWKLDVRYSPFFASLHGDPRWKGWLAENVPPV